MKKRMFNVSNKLYICIFVINITIKNQSDIDKKVVK